MWKCIRCTAEIKFAEVEPGIDDFGVYFICPKCGRRNKLVNVGQHGRIELMQTGE